MDSRIRDEQVSRNRDSRDRWAQYSIHRERITQLLAVPGSDRGRLLVFGAGNCNDLDLQKLLRTFSEIHLVDLDHQALRSGIERQGLAAESSIYLHGGVDLSGIVDQCSAWDSGTNPVSDAEISAAVNVALGYRWAPGIQDSDVTASIGLISQLVEITIRSLGDGHPRCLELLSAVRLRHMQLLFESLRPGGRGVLVTEIVSSSTCPELAQTSDTGLTDLLRQMINGRNFFTGLNPAVLEALWRRSPDLAPMIEQVEPSRPWIWDFGPRYYACWALSGVRRNE